MWLDPDDDPREGGAPPIDERTMLVEYLRRYRLTLQIKCADLDAEQMARRSVPPSTMSLLGLVRHLTEVERDWFREHLAGLDSPSLYCTADDPQGDWNGAVSDPAVVELAWQNWRNEVVFAERLIAETPDLGTLGAAGGEDARPVRDVLVHMIEEYARHCGHADLLRERIDGRVGQ